MSVDCKHVGHWKDVTGRSRWFRCGKCKTIGNDLIGPVGQVVAQKCDLCDSPATKFAQGEKFGMRCARHKKA